MSVVDPHRRSFLLASMALAACRKLPETHCALEPPARALLRDLVRIRRLSPRAQHRLRRVARTLADLHADRDPTAAITADELAQAAALRCLPDA